MTLALSANQPARGARVPALLTCRCRFALSSYHYLTQHSHVHVGFGFFYGEPPTLSASASCARFPLVLSPLSPLHPVVLGAPPGVLGPVHHFTHSRYPLAFDLI
jgi:hypothetical protein